MPSRKQPKRKSAPRKRRTRAKAVKRRPISWPAVLWVALSLNVVAGFAFSPLTGVQRVRVVGAPAPLQARIKSELQTLASIPCARIDRTDLETRLQALAGIDRASFSANLFGRGLLRMDTRKPAAGVPGLKGYAIGGDGVLYSEPVMPPGLPTVSPPEGTLHTNASLVSGWNGGAAVELAGLLAKRLPKTSWHVATDARGVISLRSGLKARVVMGSSEKLGEKAAKLAAILEADPKLLGRVSEVNLTAPDRPVIVQ